MLRALDCEPLHFSSAEVYSDCGWSVLGFIVVSLKLLALEVENGNLSALLAVLGIIFIQKAFL